MKKIYIIGVLLSFMLSACNDWLDIQPETEIRESQIFETENGFKDVLTGAYISMAKPELYGKNTTILLPEIMARHWTITTDNITKYASDFNWDADASKSLLETVWQQYYQTLANLNSLLANIDGKESLFTNGNYKLIKGEALGLRAFLHFEILRYWGVDPLDINLSDIAIPYMDKVTKSTGDLKSISYDEVFNRILRDLNEAEELLADDPIKKYAPGMLNSPGRAGSPGYEIYSEPEDDYQFYRQWRFNLYAVKAVKARYYMWRNDKLNAAKYAKEVMDAVWSTANEKVFTIGADRTAELGRLTYPEEYIFAVNNSQATATITPLFFLRYYSYATFLTQTKNFLDVAFEATVNLNDSRYTDNRLWEVKQPNPNLANTYNYFKKYLADGAENSALADVPVIRLSEMYLIAVECGNTDLFRTYRAARNMDVSIDEDMSSNDKVMARLEKEYRKEFYGEGQMFFFYKRLRYEKFTWPAAYTMTVANYKLPIPESQILFE